MNEIYDERCQGILAIEPYTGTESLRISPLKMLLFRLVIKVIEVTNSYYVVWNHSFMLRFLFAGSSARFDEKIKSVIEDIDARTFFETAKILLKNNPVPKFQDKPYVLVINNEDVSVNAENVIKNFTRGTHKLLVTHTSAEHYPKTITKEYFKERIPETEIEKMRTFIAGY